MPRTSFEHVWMNVSALEGRSIPLAVRGSIRICAWMIGGSYGRRLKATSA
jgi:hypothetical protein